MNTNDLIAGLDPTTFASISGAQLLTMVNDATPSSDRGFILVNTDNNGVPQPPAANVTTTWQRYIWIRLIPNQNAFGVYAWNPNQTYNMVYSDTSGNTVNTNWNPIASGVIPANSIQGYQLSPNTVTYDKILSIQLSQVQGSNTLLTTATTFAGAVTGTSGALVIPGNSITNAQLAAQTVLTANIALQAITPALIANGSVNQVLMTLAGPAVGWITKSLLTAPEPTVAGQVPVSTGAGAYASLLTANSSSFGKLLQVVQARSSVSSYLAGGATATQIIDTAIPAIEISGGAFVPVSTKSGFMLDGTTSGSTKVPLAISFTPISSNSKLRIKLSICMMNSGASMIAAAVYNLNPTNAVVTSGQIAYSGTVGSPTAINPMTDLNAGSVVAIKTTYGGNSEANVFEFEWLVTPTYAYGTTPYAAGTNMTLVAAVGSIGADAISINSTATNAATPLFAVGILASVFSVEEILA